MYIVKAGAGVTYVMRNVDDELVMDRPHVVSPNSPKRAACSVHPVSINGTSYLPFAQLFPMSATLGFWGSWVRTECISAIPHHIHGVHCVLVYFRGRELIAEPVE